MGIVSINIFEKGLRKQKLFIIIGGVVVFLYQGHLHTFPALTPHNCVQLLAYLSTCNMNYIYCFSGRKAVGGEGVVALYVWCNNCIDIAALKTYGLQKALDGG